MLGLSVVLILGLAGYRITRLVIDDYITAPLRKRTVEQLNPRGKIRYLLQCYWCTSMWVCAAIVLIYCLWNPFLWFMLPFALSSIVGFLSSVEDA